MENPLRKVFVHLDKSREQVAYLTQKLYGKSSEKSVCPSGQVSLFEEEASSDEDGEVPS
ncbi:transposase domain-containing protein [Streptococcus pseudopneumoniae]|uniref:transposase domain-containing protein n=1 Tax=Streptococcus pseudopneumoniae TaxID=257758 RepID=UPI0039EE45FA